MAPESDGWDFDLLAGATAGALGSAFLRTILNVAGELASISVGIYKVVDDLDNAC